MSRISTVTFKGIDGLCLADDFVRLTILPAFGGKIVELHDLRRGREWLFINSHLPIRLPEYGASYVREFDVGGFDECFPTVGECEYPLAPWKGTVLPDHGELWSVPWEFEILADRIRLCAAGRRLPYRMEKEVSLRRNGRVRLDYRLTHLSPHTMSFVWSSHPLLRIRSGMRIELPAESVRICSTRGMDVSDGQILSWPVPHDAAVHGRRQQTHGPLPSGSWPQHQGRDLAVVPESTAGIAAKLFTTVLKEGRAGLTDPTDGAAIHFEFDPEQITHVGVWMNYGGWSGVPGAPPYFNLGLEPCIGAPDRLDVAVNDWRQFGELRGHGSRDWWLEIHLT